MKHAATPKGEEIHFAHAKLLQMSDIAADFGISTNRMLERLRLLTPFSYYLEQATWRTYVPYRMANMIYQLLWEDQRS